MLNEVALVGRLTKDPEVQESQNGKKRINMTLAVPRTYRNQDGVYETDFIRIVLWNTIATNVNSYCKCGDLIGVKGRIQVTNYDDSDGNHKTITEIIAEKVTFLSSKKNE